MVVVVTRVSGALSVAFVAAAVTGCGSSGPGHRSATRSSSARKPAAAAAPQSPRSVPVPQAIPTPGPTGVPAAAGAVAVIRGWSDALRHGDVVRAAGYFALPSLMVNGPDANGNAVVTQINTVPQAEFANASLPCGARFMSADQRGRFVTALFQLTDRRGPGGGCGSGIGQTARTNFVIARGRIVEWIRAPDDPGDNSGPPAAGPSAPPALQPAGPTV